MSRAIPGDILVDVSSSERQRGSVIHFGPMVELPDFADATRTIVVADSMTRRLVPACFDKVVEVERGEAAKCLASLERLYGAFLELGAARDWTVVGVGGGSISDLAGLAAATWMRGVDFGFAPTTLLSVVDASVGGKNAVDFQGRKNLVGTFAQPRFVLVDVDNLRTLPDADLAAGIVEAIKHGIIEGEGHFALVDGAVSESGVIDRGKLEGIARLSVALKAGVVSRDEKELGERRTLNLGHTIGHAIESVTGISHGASIAAGLACAFRLSAARGGSARDLARVVDLLKRLRLPTSLEEARLASDSARALSADDYRLAVAEAMRVDKKRACSDVLFAMPRSIGSVVIEPVPVVEIEDFIRRLP